VNKSVEITQEEEKLEQELLALQNMTMKSQSMDISMDEDVHHKRKNVN